MSTPPPSDPDALPNKVRRWLWVSLALGATPYLAWVSCATEIVDEDTGFYLWTSSVALAFLGFLGSLVAGWWAHEGGLRRLRLWSAAVIAFVVTSPVATFFLGLWEPGFSYTRGRAHRRRGRARLPRDASREDWLAPIAPLVAAPAAAAEGWRLNARTEAASVAAFGHLSCELLALGAPSRLIADAHADALDEVEHARLCYGVAAAIDGRPTGPAAFRAASEPRTGIVDVESLARECVLESCWLEAASARVAEWLASRDDLPPAIRGVLEVIAEDEARHAQHGFDILAWCETVGEPGVVARACDVLERAPAPNGDGLSAGLEAWGLASAALWREATAEARTEVLARLRSHAHPTESRDARRVA